MRDLENPSLIDFLIGLPILGLVGWLLVGRATDGGVADTILVSIGAGFAALAIAVGVGALVALVALTIWGVFNH